MELTLFAVPLICEPLTCQPIAFCQDNFKHLSGLTLSDTGASSPERPDEEKAALWEFCLGQWASPHRSKTKPPSSHIPSAVMCKHWMTDYGPSGIWNLLASRVLIALCLMSSRIRFISLMGGMRYHSHGSTVVTSCNYDKQKRQ